MPYFIMKLDPISEFLSPAFDTRKEAEDYMNGMMKNYQAQGYYSTSRLERIPFDELSASVVEERDEDEPKSSPEQLAILIALANNLRDSGRNVREKENNPKENTEMMRFQARAMHHALYNAYFVAKKTAGRKYGIGF